MRSATATARRPGRGARHTERIDGEYLAGVFHAFDLPTTPARSSTSADALQAGIQTIPAWVSWRDVQRNQWEGVVFKRRDSVYPRARKKTTPAG